VLAHGPLPGAAGAAGAAGDLRGVWLALELRVSGRSVAWFVNGTRVGGVHDGTYAGMVALGCGWHTTSFDDLRVAA
jgi:hypothetical protein